MRQIHDLCGKLCIIADDFGKLNCYEIFVIVALE